MKPEFTVSGVDVQTFDEVFAELEQAYKDIYGDDINLSQDTPDGQRIGIEAKAVIDLQSFAAALYAQFDPDFAAGESLNKILKLVGIQRGPATRSTVDVTVTSDRALTLSTGYTIQDDTEQNWITESDYTLAIGANTVSFVAEEWGNIEALAGTITKQITIVPGVTSLTNAADALPGLDEETDEEVRIRRNKSLENSSYSTIGGLFAKLANITNVTDLAVYENDTDIYDAIKDLDPHTVWCIVKGGDLADIIEIIAKNKTAGAGLKGVTTGTYVETILRPDGSDHIFNHDMQFDRPTDKRLYVRLTATRTDTTKPIDIPLLQEKIAAKDYDINQDAVASSLYANGYQAGSIFVLSLMEVSEDNLVWTDESISNGFDEIFTLDTADVTVTEVV